MFSWQQQNGDISRHRNFIVFLSITIVSSLPIFKPQKIFHPNFCLKPYCLQTLIFILAMDSQLVRGEAYRNLWYHHSSRAIENTQQTGGDII